MSNIQLIHVGFGNFLAMNKVVAIVTPNSAPTKRIIAEGKSNGQVIDLTNGRKTKSVLLTDTGHVALAAINSDTIAARVAAGQSSNGSKGASAKGE